MTRPSLTKKVVCNPNYEPDLFEISINHPVPERIPHDDMNLTIIEAVGVCILEGGPKARLPVVHGMNFLNPPSNAISNLSTQSTSAVNGDSSKNSVSSSSSAVSSKHGNHREPCQPNIQPYQNAHNGNNLNNHCTQINNGNTEQHQDIQALLQQQYNMMQVLNQQQSQQPSQNTRNQNDQNHLNTQTSNGQSEPHHELQALLQQQYNLILAPNQQQHQQQRQQQPAIPALFQTFQSNSNSTSVASSMQQQNQPSSLQNPSSFLASLLDNGNLASLLGGQRSNNFSILQDFFTNSLQQQPQLRSNSTVFEGTNTSLTGNTRSSGTNLHVSQDMLNNFFESLLGGQPNNNNGGGLGTNQLQQLLAQSTSRSQSQQVRDSSSVQPAIPLMDETISAILVRAVTAGAQLGAEVSSRAENARGANGSEDFNSQSQNGNRG